MNRILVFLLLVIWPAVSSAKDPTELCPSTLKFLKDPLPETAALYQSVMAGTLADLVRQSSTDGATQAEIFCQEARSRLWNRLLQGAPSEVTALNETQLIIGDYYFFSKDFDRARDAYFRVHQSDPSNIPAALKLAKIAQSSFQRDVQRAYLEIATKKISKDPKVIGDQQEAFVDYANLLNRTAAEFFIRHQWAQAFPRDHRRALALIKIGRDDHDDKVLKEGIDLLGRVAPDAKTSSAVFYFRGWRYFEKKDFPRAQADLQTFLTNDPRDESHDQEAVELLVKATQNTKDLLGTKKWLEWAFEKGWMNEPRWLELHERSVLLSNPPGTEGLAALKKSLSYHKKSLPIETVLARRALELAESGEILETQARAPVQNLEMDFPESPEASYLSGRDRRLRKQFSKAQIFFDKTKALLESARPFFDVALRDEFLKMGAENLLSMGKTDLARSWIDWSTHQKGDF